MNADSLALRHPVTSRCVRWAALLPLLLAACFAVAQVPVPPLTAPVIDQTNTLTPEQIAALDQTLRAFHERKGSQISLLIVPTTQPEAIEQFSIRVVDSWKLGRQGIDDGALLLVAKDDRTVRIEVGRGLEGALPDVIASRIINQVITPRFRQGDFAGGITEGVNRMIAVIDGEPLPEPERHAPSAEGIGSLLPMLLMLVLVGGGMLRRVFGKVGGATATGGLAGIVAWLLSSAVGVAVGAGIFAFMFALMGGGGMGGMGGAGRWNSGRRGGFGGGWGGGFGGGGFGGGGFGGGWGGGGGGFGGGGASGRW